MWWHAGSMSEWECGWVGGDQTIFSIYIFWNIYINEQGASIADTFSIIVSGHWIKSYEHHRDAWKINIAHILSHWDNWTLPLTPHPPFVSKYFKKKSDFSLRNNKTSQFFMFLETIWFLSPSPPPVVSKSQNMSNFDFVSLP